MIPICEGLAAFESGDFELAVEKLWPLRDQWAGIGGSHAQRDIFTQILIESTINAGQYQRARTLLSQRLTIRSNSVGSWQKYAQVLTELGLTDKAAEAENRAKAIS